MQQVVSRHFEAMVYKCMSEMCMASANSNIRREIRRDSKDITLKQIVLTCALSRSILYGYFKGRVGDTVCREEEA